jgi:uncharacterized protein (DUF2252 family)
MTKEELQQALARQTEDVPGDPERAASRVEQFRTLADAAARGEFVMLPRRLDGNDRRLHVRQTLREDHRTRIAQGAEDAAVKFDKLADSLFSFFRGTALLFYRDMAGEDEWMPTVLTLGDVHPENFGVMPNINEVPIFGVNDFDEAHYAPFTWDIKRGATGFALASREIGGHKAKRQKKNVRRFVRGYVGGITRFADEGGERDHEVRPDNAPELIKELFQDAWQGREEWLEEEYLDEFKRGFRHSDDIVPVSNRRDQFQDVIDRLVERNDIDVPQRAAEMQVKDVAIRRHAGTASLGLDRFYVLVEGPMADGRDDLVIELKRARRSALAGLVPPTDHAFNAPGDRIAHAQAAQLVRGDRFYGSVEIDGRSFMSRERAPFRDDIDLDDLSKGEWKEYAETCGEALAHAHALSDEIGDLDHDIEPKIVDALGTPELFVEDMVRFSMEAADRMERDHLAFRRDHSLGAFEHLDRNYR